MRAEASCLAVRTANSLEEVAADEAMASALYDCAGRMGAVTALSARVEAASAAAAAAGMVFERRNTEALAAQQAGELARHNAECTLDTAKSEAYKASKDTSKATVAAADAVHRRWCGLGAEKTEAVRAAEKAARAARKVQKAQEKREWSRHMVHRLKGEAKELEQWRANAKEERRKEEFARRRADARVSAGDWQSAETAAAAAELVTARAARTVAMAESAAMATRLAAAEEEMKHKVSHGREVAAKRLERELSDRGESQDGLDEYDEAEMYFTLGGESFPKWMDQSVAEGGPRILKGCQWVFYRQMEDIEWNRSAAMKACFREAELAMKAKYRVDYAA